MHAGWYVLLVLVSLPMIAVGLSFVLPVKADYSVKLSPARQEACFQAGTWLSTLRFFAVREGHREEISFTLALLGRLLVLRFDYPVVKLQMKGSSPVVTLHREVEVGVGTAAPVVSGPREYGVRDVVQAWSEARIAYTSARPYLRWLRARTKVTELRAQLAGSTGDPATTAFASGMTWGLLGVLTSWAERNLCLTARPEFSVEPMYTEPYLCVDASASTSTRGIDMWRFSTRVTRALWPRLRRYYRLYRAWLALQRKLKGGGKGKGQGPGQGQGNGHGQAPPPRQPAAQQ